MADGDVERTSVLEAADESSTLATEELVQATMDKIMGKPEGDVAPDVEETPAPEPVESEVETPDKTGDVDQQENQTDEKPDESVILPAGHRRAALARGWTDEQVDHYLEINPDEAKVELGSIFEKWQDENSSWSRRGRQLAEAGPQTTENGEVIPKPESESTAIPQFDANALVEKHGNEDLINDLVGPLNTLIAQTNEAQEELHKSRDSVKRTQQETLSKVVDEFFASEDMKPTVETYGLKATELTKEQLEKRMEIFEEADLIAAGALAQGRDITVREALERGYVTKTHGSREEILRQKIRESMEKRTKTLPSSHEQTPTSNPNQSISDEELVTRTEARLASLKS